MVRRTLVVAAALALALLPGLSGSGPAFARTVAIEEGVLAGPADGIVSLIVHLEGASVIESRAKLAREAGIATSEVPAGQLQAIHDDIAQRQEPAARALEALGVTVVYRFQTIRNGFLVHATPDQVAAIAAVPGVTEINHATLLTPLLAQAVPHIGVPAVWNELGIDGTGATVAILDTGVDYTHKDFGGPGTATAYNANNPETIETGSFPTAKVIGGYDLVGEIYSPTPDCTDPPPPTWHCSREPQPDSDPLDKHFHGTHVAGIVAGMGVPGPVQGRWTVHPGVAPGAKLVALKVFGTPEGAPVTTDMSDAAIEWATASNLGVDVPGLGGVDTIGKIDVINMSLGASYAPEVIEASRVVQAAVEAGITVVASAGNEGPFPFITGSPAAADTALSVASTVPPGIQGARIDSISEFSSRGPGRLDGAIKPQVSAPGSNIVSALVGSGNGGTAASGTSMSGPMVAGVCALLWQRNYDQHLGLAPLDVAALAMNYATPIVTDNAGRLQGVNRQGAGRVRADASARGGLLVRSPRGIAGVGLGFLHLTDTDVERTTRLTVRNLSGTAKHVLGAFEWAFLEDETAGVAVTLEPDSFDLAPGATTVVTVRTVAHAADIRTYNLPPFGPVANENAFQVMEMDGWIRFTEVDGAGAPVERGDVLSVPYFVWPERDSCSKVTSAEGWSITAPDGTTSLALENPCATPGKVGVFQEIGLDREESATPGKVDITSVAVRAGPPPDTAPHLGNMECTTLTEWAIATRGARRMLYDTEFRIYLDTNHDEAFDKVVVAAYGPDYTEDIPVDNLPAGIHWTAVAGVKPDGNDDDNLPDPDWSHLVPLIYQVPTRLDERVATLPVCLDHLGLGNAPRSFSFAVAAIDYTQDFKTHPTYAGYDLAPDGMFDEPGGTRPTRYQFNETPVTCVKAVSTTGLLLSSPMTWATVPEGTASAQVKVDCAAQAVHSDVTLVAVNNANVPAEQVVNRLAGHVSFGGQVWLPALHRD